MRYWYNGSYAEQIHRLAVSFACPRYSQRGRRLTISPGGYEAMPKGRRYSRNGGRPASAMVFCGGARPVHIYLLAWMKTVPSSLGSFSRSYPPTENGKRRFRGATRN